jgi:HD superfamily phosphodiesterase/predicted RNA-binding Zn-ribbon protein involved in translation (DUF1610 family)
MDHTFCPGSKLLRQPEPEEFACTVCGGEVEIWTDEMQGTCPSCGATVYRDSTMGCLDWCQFGKECVGEVAYESYMTNKSIAVRRKLLDAVEEYFGDDAPRIDHAKRVLRFAEELLKEVDDADFHIVIPASILHDVGIKAAEEKYGRADGKLQEEEGPPIARKMVLSLGFKLEDVEEICEIIAHHHSPGVIDSANFRVLYDADLLDNSRERLSEASAEEAEAFVDRAFLTEAGKELARSELFESSPRR